MQIWLASIKLERNAMMLIIPQYLSLILKEHYLRNIIHQKR